MHIIQTQIENIENHPETGASLTVAHVLLAMVVKLIDNGHINPLIMDIFQLLAWCVAIVVGILTIIGFTKKWSKAAKSQDGTNTPSAP